MLAVVVVMLLAAPVEPYVDAAQLEVPWPAHSHLRQPYRAYLETRPGTLLQTGVGVNYNVRDNDPLAVRLLREAGVRTMRIEIGWGGLTWDETGFSDEARLRRLLSLCAEHGVRPLILLNAHHGVPCPTQFRQATLAAPAAAGDRAVRLTDVAGLEPGRSGLSNLTDYWAGECLITAVEGDHCTLARPLPKDLAAGDEVLVATLKYLPLHPVGHAEFERTAAGWERYARLAARLVREAGIDSFDVEIWNELSFGSRFTSVAHYYEPSTFEFTADFLRPGGQAWELARRTVTAVRDEAPAARLIWGFSNTTFYHCPIAELPPGIAGQSYHPYGTGTRRLPAEEAHPDRPELCLDGRCPELELRLPEGWAHLLFKTESLMRLLNPTARQSRPPGATEFAHLMTEHGVLPAECGVTDAEAAWDLKARSLLRAYPFWLNKGIDAVYWYCAGGDEPGGFGLLPTNLARLPADAEFGAVATPPLRLLRRLTEAFAVAEPLAATTPLEVGFVLLDPPRWVFPPDGGHAGLRQDEAVAVLPFQLTAERYLIVAYEMTCDITAEPVETRYRLRLERPGWPMGIRYRDPMTGRAVQLAVVEQGDGRLTVELPLTATPRLLEVTFR